MKSNYYKNLIKTVLSKSDSNDWGNAVLEWEIEDWEEDEEVETSCLCGKEHIRYLFSIKKSNIIRLTTSTRLRYLYFLLL